MCILEYLILISRIFGANRRKYFTQRVLKRDKNVELNGEEILTQTVTILN